MTIRDAVGPGPAGGSSVGDGPAHDYELPADAAELAAGLRATLARSCGPAGIRAAWPGGEPAADRRLWQQLAGLGLPALCVPSRSGGLGLDELFLVAAMDEAGYAGLPGPVIETTAVVAPLLAAAGPVADEDLAGLLSGDVRATFGRLGRATAYAQVADLSLLESGDELFLVRGTAATSVATVDGSRRSGVFEADQARTALEVPDPDRQLAFERGALAAAAQLLGLARRMLDMTVAYTLHRRQFGHPIGSFQAVKHTLADAVVAMEFTRPLVYRAARSLMADATGTGRALQDVSAAKACASELATTVSRAAIQCHGAIAYTTEYDLHLFAKRSWALASDWGDAAWHRDRLAGSLGL